MRPQPTLSRVTLRLNPAALPIQTSHTHGAGSTPEASKEAIRVSSPTASHNWPERRRIGRVIRRARQRHGWSQPRLIHEMRLVTAEPLPDLQTLRSQLSRWEHGHQMPDRRHRWILARALKLAPHALLLTDEPTEPPPARAST